MIYLRRFDMLYENFKEFSLEDQLDWFKATLHSIHDGVLVIDSKEIVKLINPEYTRITGVQPNEIIGKPLRLVRPKAQLIETLKDGKERIGVYRKEGTVEYVVDMAPIILNKKPVIPILEMSFNFNFLFFFGN